MVSTPKQSSVAGQRGLAFGEAVLLAPARGAILMSRFTAENTILAREIIARYPRPKSALIPLLHLAQEQDGYVADDAMEHIAELIGITPAEVLGTCSFYEMFKREPVGEYLVNVCTNIACMLLGGEELLHHLEERLGITSGQHHRRRSLHDRGRRVHRGLHRGAVPPGELPLLLQGHPGRRRRAHRRPAARPAGPRGAEARRSSPARAQILPPERGPATPCPGVAEEPVWLRTAAAARRQRDRHRRGADRHHPLRARRRPHPRAATSPPAATQGLKAALAKAPTAVGDEVKAASLLGRGGAGFPAGTKWGFCPPGVWPRYLVVNGDESEPGTYKDRLLMEKDPHQLIEGVLIACYAIGAAQAFLYVRGEMALAQERIAQALNDAYAAGYIGKNILGTDFSVDVVLHWGAGAYIVGEETALIESLEGNRGMPRLKPPFFPAAKGLYLQPTVVNNVETLANLPWIMTNGGAEFAELGAEKAPGMRLFAVSGHVKHPGVYEVEFGVTTFRDLIYAPVYGGGIRDGNELKAFIPGGASAPWFFDEHLDIPLEPGVVGPSGSMLGSGAIVVMDATTDMVKACWRLVRFFARESCGKCTPCREGTSWLEKVLARLLDGHGRPDDVALLLDVVDNITPAPFPKAKTEAGDWEAVPFPYKKTTICALGPSVGSPIVSAVVHFRDEFEAYVDRGVPVEVAGV